MGINKYDKDHMQEWIDENIYKLIVLGLCISFIAVAIFIGW